MKEDSVLEEKRAAFPTLLAGAGKACINPPAECFPLGVNATNAKTSGTPARSEVHDDCHVRLLALDNGETRAVIASFDLVVPPPAEQTKALISSITKAPSENILLCATHNHDYPFDYSPYMETILNGVRQAAVEAVNSMRPAKYGFGEGESHINMNRDFQTEDGNWTAYNTTAGYSDKTLAILKIVDEQDNLIAAVMNYCAHAVLVTSHLDFDGKLKLSSDFPGYAAGYLERRFGNGAVVLWTSGASGDQNPLITPYLFRYEDDGYIIRERMPNGMAFLLIESLGGQHAIDAVRIINGIHADKRRMRIHTSQTTALLPAQQPPAGADMVKNRMIVDHLVPPEKGGKRFEGERVRMLDVAGKLLPLEISLLQLGDTAWVCFGDELYCKLGSHIKQVSPVKNTVVVTLTSAGKHKGYILDKDSATHNTFQSYGVYKPGACDEPIIRAVKTLFD